MEAILNGMGIVVERSELQNYLGQMKKDFNEEEIDFELFVRVVAFLLELRNFEGEEVGKEEEEEVEEERKWFNQE